MFVAELPALYPSPCLFGDGSLRVHRVQLGSSHGLTGTSTNKNVTTKDVVTIVFEMTGGAVGNLQVSQIAPGHKNWLTFKINAERQTLIFDQEKPESLKLGTKAGFLTAVRSADVAPEAARYSVVPAGHPRGIKRLQRLRRRHLPGGPRSAAGRAPDLPTVTGLPFSRKPSSKSARTGGWIETPPTVQRSLSPHPDQPSQPTRR